MGRPIFKFWPKQAFILFSLCKIKTSREAFPIMKNPLFGRDSGNSELRVVLAQFAHYLFDSFKFPVNISENNWDGIKIIEVGWFWASWSSRSTGRATLRRGVK